MGGRWGATGGDGGRLVARGGEGGRVGEMGGDGGRWGRWGYNGGRGGRGARRGEGAHGGAIRGRGGGGDQKIAVSRVVNNMLRKVHCNSWERQAMRGRIRIVRTLPHSVRRCFEFHANRAEIAPEEPDCFCSDAYTHISQKGWRFVCA